MPWVALDSVAVLVRWDGARMQSPLQRSLRDDVVWGLAVLVGVTAGYLVLDADAPGLLLGAVLGVVLVIVVLNVVRRVRPRRRT
jgi:hypothetical protein